MDYQMTNSKNGNEMTSKKLRHKTKIQHTKGSTRNGSTIDLKQKIEFPVLAVAFDRFIAINV